MLILNFEMLALKHAQSVGILGVDIILLILVVLRIREPGYLGGPVAAQ